MINETMRIAKIELKNFKNVAEGSIEMPSYKNRDSSKGRISDVVGIYGQNGSGKTAVVEAISFVQSLMMGESLQNDFAYYIGPEADSCVIKIIFSFSHGGEELMPEYEVAIKKSEDGLCEIEKETLRLRKKSEDGPETKKILIKCAPNGSNISVRECSGKMQSALKKSKGKNRAEFAVALLFAQKNKNSFIFGKETKPFFTDKEFEEANSEYAYVVKALFKYVVTDLFVIKSSHSAPISMNAMLPLSFKVEDENIITKGDLAIRLNGPSDIRGREYKIVCRIIREINVVLRTIIPGMEVVVKDHGKRLLRDGSEGRRIELASKRGETLIPLVYESEGIKKIISVLHVLMRVYANPGTCLAIDEMDSGIFEFLLGELISVLDDGAAGQLIFTSHNLRALEMMRGENLYFTTTNPKKRYIRLRNVKTNNNLRSLYMRTITLGGQREEIYAMTDTTEIGRAFRKAGRAEADGR